MPIVYLYRGTFNPFHNNHAAICKWCLEQSNNPSLVIHINYKDIAKKNVKHPASWENRVDIVNRALNSMKDKKPLSNVMVSDQKEFSQTLEWITQKYGPEIQIIHVLGDDVLTLAKDSPSIHAYAVHQRNNIQTDSISSLFNKERINIPLQLPPISSTHIRALLIKREMSVIATMVPDSILPVLNTIKDYSSLQLSIQELKQNQIYISDLFAEKLVEFFGKDIYLAYEPEVFGGLSGDYLVPVYSHEIGRIAICKIFSKGEAECITEFEGYQKLATYVKTPTIHFICENGFCMELISGKNAQLPEDFIRIGQAYHLLHANSRSETVVKPEKNDNLEKKILTLCSQFKDMHLTRKIGSLFKTLLEEYYITPRPISVIHGDSQPGNTFITTKGVVFIDASKVKTVGDPSNDLHQMVSSLYWITYQDKNTENIEELKNKITAFLDGYNAEKNSPAYKLWAFYWQVRTVLLAMETPNALLSKDIISTFEQDHPQLMTDKPQYPFWSAHPSNHVLEDSHLDAHTLKCEK